MHISRLLSDLLSPSYRARRWYLRHVYRHLAPEHARTRLSDGTVLHLQPRHDYVQREIFLQAEAGRYERHVLHWLHANLRDGMAVLDIGAHVGYFAGAVCRHIGQEGRAIFVEPFPTHYILLKENLEINGFTNGSALNVAASDRTGTLTFYPASDGGRNSLAPSGIADLSPILVRSVMLDDLLAECALERVDVMQIDVEGAECLVLNTKQLALSQRRISCILCELHPLQMRQEFSCKSVEFVDGICRLGYSASSLDPNSGSEHPFDRATADHYQHLIFRSNRA